jgi:hypothetical protein
VCLHYAAFFLCLKKELWSSGERAVFVLDDEKKSWNSRFHGWSLLGEEKSV